MGLFNKKKSLPDLPKPSMQSSSENHEDFNLPDFPANDDFPSYNSLEKDMGSIKKAVMPSQESMPRLSGFNEPEQESQPSMKEKTLFVKIDDYEVAMSAVERVKEKVKDIESVLASLEKLKRQEDNELDNWHRDLDSLKQKLLAVENRLFKV